jgi:hypothetical protein
LITTDEEDEMLDKFEGIMEERKLAFSQRHRLRWWAMVAIRFWIRETKPVKVQFD